MCDDIAVGKLDLCALFDDQNMRNESHIALIHYSRCRSPISGRRNIGLLDENRNLRYRLPIRVHNENLELPRHGRIRPQEDEKQARKAPGQTPASHKNPLEKLQ